MVSCCTIDWFDSWTEEALIEVSKKMVNKMELDDNMKKSFVQLSTEANLIVQELCT